LWIAEQKECGGRLTFMNPIPKRAVRNPKTPLVTLPNAEGGGPPLYKAEGLSADVSLLFIICRRTNMDRQLRVAAERVRWHAASQLHDRPGLSDTANSNDCRRQRRWVVDGHVSRGGDELARNGFVTYQESDGLGPSVGAVFEDNSGELCVVAAMF